MCNGVGDYTEAIVFFIFTLGRFLFDGSVFSLWSGMSTRYYTYSLYPTTVSVHP